MNTSASARFGAARGLLLTAMLTGLLAGCAVPPSGDNSADEAPTAESTSSAPADRAVAEPQPTSTETVDPDTVHATELNVGDCVIGLEEEEINDVDVVPCDQPHAAEVYAAYDMDPGAYPGEEAIVEAGETFCMEEVTGYIGENFEKPGAPDVSDVIYAYLSPTPKSWTLGGDREILCYFTTEDGALTTGSLRGVLD